MILRRQPSAVWSLFRLWPLRLPPRREEADFTVGAGFTEDETDLLLREEVAFPLPRLLDVDFLVDLRAEVLRLAVAFLAAVALFVLLRAVLLAAVLRLEVDFLEEARLAVLRPDVDFRLEVDLRLEADFLDPVERLEDDLRPDERRLPEVDDLVVMAFPPVIVFRVLPTRSIGRISERL